MDEAINSRRKAAEFYHRAGRKDNELFAYIETADCLSGGKWQYSETLELLDSVRYLIEGMDSDIIACYFESYIYPLKELGRNEEALDYYYYRHLKYKTDSEVLTRYENIAEIYLRLGNEDSMLHYIEKSREFPDYIDNSGYHDLLYKIAYAKGDLDSALKEMTIINKINLNRSDSALRQEIAL